MDIFELTTRATRASASPRSTGTLTPPTLSRNTSSAADLCKLQNTLDDFFTCKDDSTRKQPNSLSFVQRSRLKQSIFASIAPLLRTAVSEGIVVPGEKDETKSLVPLWRYSQSGDSTINIHAVYLVGLIS